MWVEVGGWQEFGDAVGYADGPVGVVDGAVVVAAQKCQVFQCGRPAVLPLDDVVNLADRVGPVAAGEGAVFVALYHCAADGGRNRAGGLADIEWL